MSQLSDGILLLGLNKSAHHEAMSLRRQGNSVYFVGNGDERGKFSNGDKVYNLNSAEGINDFVVSLGLPVQQNRKITNALRSAGLDIRDELAGIAKVWATMEISRRGPNRFIISGHSAFGMFWGDDNGFLDIDTIKLLADAMPIAASMIEDLHLSACYSGSEPLLRKWRDVFPNLFTIWAYDGSAPGSYSGAMTHMQRWETVTRGSRTELDRMVADKTRKGDAVAVWSRDFGYRSKKSTSITALISRVRNAESMFQEFFSGDRTVVNTQSGPLRIYYNDLNDLVGHPSLSPEQRLRYQERGKVTIRLIYFDKTVKHKFAEKYAEIISKGYKALKMSAPNFAQMSRKDCLKEISFFETKSAQSTESDVTALKRLLLSGLMDLNEILVPANWI